MLRKFIEKPDDPRYEPEGGPEERKHFALNSVLEELEKDVEHWITTLTNLARERSLVSRREYVRVLLHDNIKMLDMLLQVLAIQNSYYYVVYEETHSLWSADPLTIRKINSYNTANKSTCIVI